MKVTVAKYNNDGYIIIETEGRTITYKAKMIMKTSEISHTKTEDFKFESEVFEATFLREENNKNKPKEEAKEWKI